MLGLVQRVVDESLEDGDTLLSLTGRDQKVSLEGFTLACDIEDELAQLIHQLLVRDPASAPPVDAKVGC